MHSEIKDSQKTKHEQTFLIKDKQSGIIETIIFNLIFFFLDR
jgi:hypothetical protein